MFGFMDALLSVMSSPKLHLSRFLFNLLLLKLIEITIHDTFCCASKFQGQPTESVSKNAPSSNHLGSVIEKIEGLYVVCKVLCTSSLFFGDNVTQIDDEVLIFIAFIWLKHLLDALHFNFWSFLIYVHQKDYIPHIAF